MLNRLFAFVRRQDGAIAVEFALIVPVLLLMFFGSFELARAIDCHSRVVEATATVADLVSQESTSITADDVKKILCGAKGVIYPYPVSGTIQLRVTSFVCATYASGCTAVSYPPSGGWSVYTSGYTGGGRTSLPSNLQLNMFPAYNSGSGSGVIMAEMTYTYTSPTTMFLASTITMRATSYSAVRSIKAISYLNASGTSVINDTITECTV